MAGSLRRQGAKLGLSRVSSAMVSRAVLFDVDGTLIEPQPLVSSERI